MGVKEHYEGHLAKFYSWMAGDFTQKQDEHQKFFERHEIIPRTNKVALDLGSGHGIQSVTLATLGFDVMAIDFNYSLLNELSERAKDAKVNIHAIEDDILNFLSTDTSVAELVVCMGDTLAHLESLGDVKDLFSKVARRLAPSGKFVVSFRDLVTELNGVSRFIPVKNDDQRILTCFLEYFPNYVMVHDILHERQNDAWVQKISSYPKLRLNEKVVTDIGTRNGLQLQSSENINRKLYLIFEKNA